MQKLIFATLIGAMLLMKGCTDDPIAPTPGRNTAGTYYKTLTDNNGQEREYIVYVPQSAAGTDKVPVVFMIHGTNQSGQVFYNNNNLWNPKADQEGFIVVYPTALVYCHFDNGTQRTVTKWAAGDLGETDVNMGALPLCSGETLSDDLYFFDQMIATIKSEFVVDEKRIYATGHSNGAQMTARLGAQRSDVFAAVAVHAGNYSRFLPVTLSQRPMSMMLSVGANDELFAEAVNMNLPIPVDSNLLNNQGVVEVLQPFLDINGLDNQYTYSSLQYFNNEIADFLFEESTIGLDNKVRFMLIENLGHGYTQILINPFWTFFEGQTLP